MFLCLSLFAYLLPYSLLNTAIMDVCEGGGGGGGRGGCMGGVSVGGGVYFLFGKAISYYLYQQPDPVRAVFHQNTAAHTQTMTKTQ